MNSNSDFPRVLYCFDLLKDRDEFVSRFNDDFELLICESEEEAEIQLENPDSRIDALVLDQDTVVSRLSALSKSHNSNRPVILLHRGIALDSIVDLLDEGTIDKCFAKPYDKNVIRSEIYTSFFGVDSQNKSVETHNRINKRYSVLIVDDETVATKFLKKQLEKLDCDCEIVVADDAEQALEIFAQKKENLAIIISDQRMPGMQGNQLLTEVQKHSPQIIRMLTSAYEEVDIALNAVNEGKIYRYIKKPWDASELNELIKQALVEFKSRLVKASDRQTGLNQLYEEFLAKRELDLMNALQPLVDQFSGPGTLNLFFEGLRSISTLPPNSSSLRASQETSIEADLVSEFSQMIQNRVEKLSIINAHQNSDRSPEGKTFAEVLAENTGADWSTNCLLITTLTHGDLGQELINCLKRLLNASGLDYSAMELINDGKNHCIKTKDRHEILLFKHILGAHTQVTAQLLKQQCDMLILLMIGRKLNIGVGIDGGDQKFGLRLQLPSNSVTCL